MISSILSLDVVRSVLMIAVGVAPVIVWRRRSRTGFSVFAIGAAAWVVGVALKVAWAVPMNRHVQHALEAALGDRIGSSLFYVYVGALTGVFEVGLVALLASRVRRLRTASREEAIAFGLAFGGIEAIVLGLGAALGQDHASVVAVFTGPIERLSATVFHVVSAALVLRGFAQGTAPRSFGLSFLYKSSVDVFAAWAILSFGVGASTSKLLAFEGVVALAAIASVLVYGLRASRGVAHVHA